MKGQTIYKTSVHIAPHNKHLISILQVIQRLEVTAGITIEIQIAKNSAFLDTLRALIGIDHPILLVIISISLHKNLATIFIR